VWERGLGVADRDCQLHAHPAAQHGHRQVVVRERVLDALLENPAGLWQPAHLGQGPSLHEQRQRRRPHDVSAGAAARLPGQLDRLIGRGERLIQTPERPVCQSLNPARVDQRRPLADPIAQRSRLLGQRAALVQAPECPHRPARHGQEGHDRLGIGAATRELAPLGEQIGEVFVGDPHANAVEQHRAARFEAQGDGLG
jgi:hypothetical protein